MRAALLCVAAVLPALTMAIEEPAGSKVNVLTYNNFKRFMKKNPLVLMEFYAPWCGHCKQLAEPYRHAAAELAEMDLPRPVKLAKMDDSDDTNRRLRAGAPEVYNYSHYPSLMVFDHANKNHTKQPATMPHASWYAGGRESGDIVAYMEALAKGLDPIEEEKKTKPNFYRDGKFSEGGYVTDFEPSTFEDIVINGKDNVVWVVEFYSDRCHICKGLGPQVVEAAKELQAKLGGQVKVGAVNSRIYHEVAEAHGVTSYPWVTSFYRQAGPTGPVTKVEDMAGLSGKDSIVNWGTRIHSRVWKAVSDEL